MEEAGFSLLPGRMWSPRPGCDHSCLGGGPAFSSPLQYQSSAPESRRGAKHIPCAGADWLFLRGKNLLQGFYSASHILQNTSQGSSSGQDWETLWLQWCPGPCWVEIPGLPCPGDTTLLTRCQFGRMGGQGGSCCAGSTVGTRA